MENDQRCGKGVLYQKNGDRYEGEFVDGKCNGYGIQYHPDGTSSEGVWKDNKLAEDANRRKKVNLYEFYKDRYEIPDEE